MTSSSNSMIKFYKDSYIELSGNFLGENITYELFYSFNIDFSLISYYNTLSSNNVNQNSITYSDHLQKFCIIGRKENTKESFTILLDNDFQSYNDLCKNVINQNSITIGSDPSYQKLFIEDASINVLNITNIVYDDNHNNSFISVINIENTINPNNTLIAVIDSTNGIDWTLKKVFLEFTNLFRFQTRSLSIVNKNLIITGNIWNTQPGYMIAELDDLTSWNITPSDENIYSSNSVIPNLPLTGTIHNILYLNNIGRYIAFVNKTTDPTANTTNKVGYSLSLTNNIRDNSWSSAFFFDFMSSVFDAYYDTSTSRVFAVGDFGTKLDYPGNYEPLQPYAQPKIGSRGIILSGIVNTIESEPHIIWDISRSQSIIPHQHSNNQMGLIYSIKKINYNNYVLAGRSLIPSRESITNINVQENTYPVCAILNISGSDFSYNIYAYSENKKINITFVDIEYSVNSKSVILLGNNFINHYRVYYHPNIEKRYRYMPHEDDKIYLTRKINSTKNVIGLTHFNLNNYTKKENNKLFFYKKNRNIINKGFTFNQSSGNYTSSKIQLPYSLYMFNTNDISNNSTVIINYKLYPLTPYSNTTITNLNLENTGNGLLKNITDYNINDVSWINNNYIEISYNNPLNNIIKSIDFKQPASISLEIFYSDISKHILNLSYTFNQQSQTNSDISFYLIDSVITPTIMPINIDILQYSNIVYQLNDYFTTSKFKLNQQNFEIIHYNTNINNQFINSRNLTPYLNNNIFNLYYNNKNILFENINLNYKSGNNIELVLRSLNRFFIGTLTGQFRLSYSNINILTSNVFEVTINVICNPNLCRLPGLPDRRETSYKLGSSASFRMQFSKNIQNSNKRRGRKTRLIENK